MKKECVSGDQITFTVNIPKEHLRSWYDLKEERGFLPQFSYVQILNALIAEQGIKFKEDCSRIDGLIRRSSSEVKNKYRARVQFLCGARKFVIRQDELIKIGLIEKQIDEMRENAKELSEENERLQKCCEEL